ncbi:MULTISPECIES: hypothetical protein [unclassified Candidatus Frackibacter]|uniref:hypothetical protein n=1 Tax=unclassified Candidatus Frackibacter TaxID=2648818 RepID=UPI0008803EE4|nr:MULTISPECIES: hypothetical protein [unclassified Candidatus Frackibacter]SDC31425.1 hypothetical protein SAMN04515661_10695 [Candidatus Frackibacter sp. WG11]SFL59294.1 hypothetical protein SAMN04488699_10694 [Candidatus Frackibacter sp. WG13]
MKKKILLLVLVGVLMLAYNLNTFALLGDQAIPQAVYRVPMGSEVKYLEDNVQKLLYLNEQVMKLKKQLDQYKDQEALFRALLGNSKLLDLADYDFDNMSLEEWKEVIRTAADIIYADVDVVKSSTNNKPSKQRVEKIKEFRKVMAGDSDSESQSNDQDPIIDSNPDTSKQERNEEQIKNLKARLNNLSKLYNQLLSRYMNLEIYKDKSSQPIVVPKADSMPTYIKKTQKDLEQIEDNMAKNQNLKRSNIPALLQSLNKQMLFNNQINLKILQALSDLNKMQAVKTNKDSIDEVKEDYIEMKHKLLN